VSFADYAQITDPRSPRAVEEFAAWGGQVLPTAEYHIVADWEEDGSYTDWVPVDRAVEFFPLWFRWFTVTTYRRPAREPEWPAS
jgi:hypothetical protein